MSVWYTHRALEHARLAVATAEWLGLVLLAHPDNSLLYAWESEKSGPSSFMHA